MEEHWVQLEKPYEAYKVSNLGRVIGHRGTYLKTHKKKRSASATVALHSSDRQKRKYFLLNKLVVKYHNKDYREELRIRHLDGDPLNCRVDNLVLFNPKEESKDVNLPDKVKLRELIVNSLSMAEIARECHVCETTVYRLIANYELTELLHTKARSSRNLTPPRLDDKPMWKQAEGYPPYEVSVEGNIREISSGKYLTKHLVEDMVYVKVNSGRKPVHLGRLIAKTFLDNPNQFRYLGYLDGNPCNVRLDNLVWTDRKIFKKRSVQGRDYSPTVPLHVREMVQLLTNESAAKVASKLGITTSDLRVTLSKYGFPESKKRTVESVNYHMANGTLTEYLRGDFNITRVERLGGEEFRMIKDIPGYYISNLGRVMSHATFKREIIVTEIMRAGYPYVSLRCDGKVKTIAVAQLVARAWIPNPRGYRRCLNLDGDKLNCKVQNLKWVSDKEYNRVTFNKIDKECN